MKYIVKRLSDNKEINESVSDLLRRYNRFLYAIFMFGFLFIGGLSLVVGIIQRNEMADLSSASGGISASNVISIQGSLNTTMPTTGGIVVVNGTEISTDCRNSNFYQTIINAPNSRIYAVCYITGNDVFLIEYNQEGLLIDTESFTCSDCAIEGILYDGDNGGYIVYRSNDGSFDSLEVRHWDSANIISSPVIVYDEESTGGNLEFNAGAPILDSTTNAIIPILSTDSGGNITTFSLQKVNTSPAEVWTGSGGDGNDVDVIPVVDANNHSQGGVIDIASSGAVVAVIEDYVSDPGTFEQITDNIYLQKFNSSGVAQYGSGIVVGAEFFNHIDVAVDNNDDVFIFNNNTATSVYRYNSAGTNVWTVSSASLALPEEDTWLIDFLYTIVPSENGGTWIVWEQYESPDNIPEISIYAKKVNPNGSVDPVTLDIAVTSVDRPVNISSIVLPDDEGGFYIVWGSDTINNNTGEIAFNRIQQTGVKTFDDDRIVVQTEYDGGAETSGPSSAIVDDRGHLLISWFSFDAGDNLFFTQGYLMEFQIADLDPSLNIVTEADENVEFGTGNFLAGVNSLVLELVSGVPLAYVQARFSHDLSWPDVLGDSDNVQKKSWIEGLDSFDGLFIDDHTIFVPHGGDEHNAIRICPDATSFVEIASGCPGEYIVSQDSPNVAVTNVDGDVYWTVSGVAGTGGESIIISETCGNDIVEGIEVCDGIDLDGESCTTQGFTGGTLSCNLSCDGLVTTACTSGSSSSSSSSTSSSSSSSSSSTTSSSSSTSTSGDVCGNGVKSSSEQCDGFDFGEVVSCTDVGYASGTLSCNSDCTYNTSSCVLDFGMESCVDEIDNDGDGYTDCLDQSCEGIIVCFLDPDQEWWCNDGIDNDSNGDIDCDDAMCASRQVCSVSTSSSSPGSQSSSSSQFSSVEGSQSDTTSSSETGFGGSFFERSFGQFSAITEFFTERSPFYENLLNQLPKTGNSVIDNIIENTARYSMPVIEISLATGIFGSIFLFTNNLLFSYGLSFGSILPIFSFKRKAYMGIVYDKATFRPIAFAVVRVLIGQKTLLQTVTNLSGKYSIELKEGEYTFTVEHDLYEKVSLPLHITDLSHSVCTDIGLLKRQQKYKNIIKLYHSLKDWIHENVSAFLKVLIGFGFLLSIIFVIINPTLLNFINTAVYMCVIAFTLIYVLSRADNWGFTFNSSSKKPIQGAFVRLFNSKEQRLIDTQITDTRGRFGFIIEPGTYLLLVTAPGYIFPSTSARSDDIEKTFYGSLLRFSTKQSRLLNIKIPLDKSVESQDLINPQGLIFASPFH